PDGPVGAARRTPRGHRPPAHGAQRHPRADPGPRARAVAGLNHPRGTGSVDRGAPSPVAGPGRRDRGAVAPTARETPPGGSRTLTRLLEAPLPAHVEVATGIPVRVVVDGGGRAVKRVCARWRVESDWWRQPVSREYWKLEL